jgi:parvulin-like peptidyl-prolyl isomerase|tara:strand:+ start:3405 stop:4205 length:801 start_codon:yes stop_codon:yes gene_type:complete
LKRKIFTFVCIGLFIYLIDIGFNSEENSKNIYISDQEITSLISAWKSQVGRNPTDDEIARIINNLVEEEILYREALLLDLDKEDRIIKRRLAQKITFLKQETLTDTPSNAELIEYYDLNKDKYYTKPTYSFTHYFYSAENNSKIRSELSFKEILKGNQNITSDPFFLGKNFIDKTTNEISRNFGTQFSLQFDDIPVNEWVGPFKSSFGHHIVLVRDSKPGYYPLITEVLNRVEVDLFNANKEAAINNYINQVKSEYKVIINPNLKF